jgi:hypothetical protein
MKEMGSDGIAQVYMDIEQNALNLNPRTEKKSEKNSTRT